MERRRNHDGEWSETGIGRRECGQRDRQARTRTDRQMDGEMTIIILLRRHLILSLLPPHRTRADGILPTG